MKSAFTRRSLLHIGGAGLFGTLLPAWLDGGVPRRAALGAKSVIFLHQWGGPSQLDTFDMKPDAPGRGPRRVQADRARSARASSGLRAAAAHGAASWTR